MLMALPLLGLDLGQERAQLIQRWHQRASLIAALAASNFTWRLLHTPSEVIHPSSHTCPVAAMRP